MGVVQRAPQGLLDALSMKGVENLPQEFSRMIVPTLDLLQFYGLQQRQTIFTNDPALAEAGAVFVTPATNPIINQWGVLFGATAVIVKTGTMTAARLSLELIRGQQFLVSNSISLASADMGPFGATETGAASLSFWAPYPILLQPPWQLFTRLQILGTDATASCTCIAEIGTFG